MTTTQMTKIEYARVEVRTADGRTYAIELDPARLPITASIEVENESREVPNDGAWRFYEPTGHSRADIRLTGWIKTLERS